MEFTASSKYVYTGESVELMCTIYSATPDYPTIELRDGGILPSHNLNEFDVDDYTVRVEVLIHEQNENKVDYVCVMDNSEEDELVKQLEQELSIFSYGIH